MVELKGTSPKYLSRIETGRENPTLDLFARLAKGLQTDLYEILKSVKPSWKHLIAESIWRWRHPKC